MNSKPSPKLTTLLVGVASSLDLSNVTVGKAADLPRDKRDDSEALKSANAKINKVRQERRLWLMKEREVRSLNFREQRELTRNFYT